LRHLTELDKNDDLYTKLPAFATIKFYEKLWRVTSRDTKTGETTVYVTPYVNICSGHHAEPIYADFPGQDTFPGEIVHSVKFKSSTINGMNEKSVLVVGIGNSAVDAAVNLYNEGKCKKVFISSRSGAWIVPNYVQGFATDLYACRVFLSFPWKVSSFIFESIVKFIYGNPKKYLLKMNIFCMDFFINFVSEIVDTI
jgi:cation diffusion facilitator CzcD-associated flavoprotein CzcO